MNFAIKSIEGSEWLVEVPEKGTDKPIYQLPMGKTDKEIILKVMTSVIYESHRHHWQDKDCLYGRKAVQLLIEREDLNQDIFFELEDSKSSYEKELKRFEREENSYWGTDLSDDSDNEDDIKSLTSNQKKQLKLIEECQQTDKFWTRTKLVRERSDGLEKLLKDLIIKIDRGTIKQASTIENELKDTQKKLFDEKTKDRAELPYVDLKRKLSKEQEEAIESIKTMLNEARKNPSLQSKATEEIKKLCEKHKFYIVQYRGIHYFEARWNAPSRRYHRKMEESQFPQFSEMVLKTLNFDFYRELKKEHDYTIQDKLQEILQKEARKVRDCLLELRKQEYCLDFSDEAKTEPYLFNNVLERLNHSYSNGIKNFLKEIKELREDHEYWKSHFPNARNPFVSVANTATHALVYAYGRKPYYEKAFQQYPMKPRYSADGKLEYLHVGKIYLSIHKAGDLLFGDCPNNIVQCDAEGRVILRDKIPNEKETSYLGYVNGEDVKCQFVAKFPQFHTDIDTLSPKRKVALIEKYEQKYGITESLYRSFKKLIGHSKIHSELRTAVIDLLSEHLICYHEILLNRMAFQLIEKEGTLLFFNQEGILSDTPPTVALTPGAKNLDPRTSVHVQREVRRQIAQDLKKEKGKNFHGFKIVNPEVVKEKFDRMDKEKIVDKIQSKEGYQNVSPKKVEAKVNLFDKFGSPSPTLTRIIQRPITSPLDSLRLDMDNITEGMKEIKLAPSQEQVKK